jgi:hypothetical protein
MKIKLEIKIKIYDIDNDKAIIFSNVSHSEKVNLLRTVILCKQLLL